MIGRRVAVERTFGLDNTLLEHKETYSLECWGETRDQASDLEDQVVTLLVGAGLPPDPNGPDGIDPVVDVRCCVIFVISGCPFQRSLDSRGEQISRIPSRLSIAERRQPTGSAGHFIGEALSSRR